MFYFCSHLAIRSIRRFWPSVFAAAAVLIMALAGGLSANHGISNHKVQARVDLMVAQKAALAVLTEMASTRRPFNRDQARAARKTLKGTTEKIPKRFRRPHRDPHSLAKPAVWHNWDDFTRHAERANAAANGLNTRTLVDLRRSLPALIQSCTACHDEYKEPGHEFTTH
ncbi:cytochrome c [Epibacterium ulvae]|nr:cytochrome c [Epibacterium ulvae]